MGNGKDLHLVAHGLKQGSYFIGYFTGMMEILKMRDQFKEKMGNAFSLKDFHDRLMKIGNMPPSLMSEALMNGVAK